MSSKNKTSVFELAKIANQAKKEAGKKISKRVNINWRTVIVVLVYASSLFVTALKEFVATDVSIAYIQTTEFWTSIIFNTVNNWFLLFAIFIYILDKLIRSKQTKDIKNKLLGVFENLKSSILYLFLGNFNRERRINKYKHILDQELEKIDEKASRKDHLTYLQGTEEEKENNEYCIIKKELLKTMDQDYLEEHIDEVYVRMKPITKQFIKYGYTKVPKGYSDPYETESGFKKAVRDLGPKLLLGLAIIVTVQAIDLTPVIGVKWTAAVVAILFRLYPIFVHTYIGIVYANQYYEEKILVDLDKRLDIALQAETFQEEFLESKPAEKDTVEEKNKEYPIVKLKEANNYG